MRMNLYSHLAMAREVEPLVQPGDTAEYAWGAVIPDIRYLAEMRREQTHVPLEQVDAWMACFPHLRDFLLGYRVHLLADKIDLVAEITAQPPGKWVRRLMKQRRAAVFYEYALLRQREVEWLVSGSYNEVMEELGITPEQVALFAPVVNHYVATASLHTALEGFRQMGMLSDHRIDAYARMVRQVERFPLLQGLVIRMVDTERLAQIMRALVIEPQLLEAAVDVESGEYESPLEI